MCDYELTAGSKVRIMPDVHAGKGCTVGTTMTVIDKAVPNIVGVDIGCGMYTVCLGKTDIDFEKFDESAHFIPCSMNVWKECQEHFDLTALRCYGSLTDINRLEYSLGTLGGGNHFIEIDTASDSTKYLVIHSGSRNLGKQVAEFYQQAAVDLNTDKETYFRQRDEIINTYKEQGRQSEIREALRQLAKDQEAKKPALPDDLCYLYGSSFDDYLHDVEICQRFAKRNREKMAELLLEHTGMVGYDAFHTIHNYINTEEMILRKGGHCSASGRKGPDPDQYAGRQYSGRGQGQSRMELLRAARGGTADVPQCGKKQTGS